MPSRRAFLTGLGTVAAAIPLSRLAHALPRPAMSSFKLSVLTDEISQALGRACEVASREFGLGLVELRAMHNKNVMSWDAHDIAEAKSILAKYNLRVSEIASPIFKTDWPGAPKSPFSPKNPQFGADFTYEQQDELIERAVDLAKALDTRYIRIFDFWRLDDQTPHRKAIDDRVREASIKVGKKAITFTLENELACNTATGAEAARLLGAIREKSLMLNWDPGNARARGENAFPDGYAKIPKDRIAHMHLKDVRCGAATTAKEKAEAFRKQGTRVSEQSKCQTAIVGTGQVDLAGQLRALLRDKYDGTMSLEPEYEAPGVTHFEATRRSLEGLLKIMATTV